jgi:hypothetical protein
MTTQTASKDIGGFLGSFVPILSLSFESLEDSPVFTKMDTTKTL